MRLVRKDPQVISKQHSLRLRIISKTMRQREAGKWRKYRVHDIQRTTHVCEKGHSLHWKGTDTRYLCKKCNEYYVEDGHGKIIKFKLEGDENDG